MIYITLVLAALIAGLIALLVQARCEEAQRKGTSTSKELAGICAAATHRTLMKEANKAKVLELLTEQGEPSNSDLRHEIGVSRSTIVRYMNELEKESRVKQFGETGQSVVCRLPNNPVAI